MGRMGNESIESHVRFVQLMYMWLTILGDDDYPNNGLHGTKSLRFFEWKARANISERSFDKLRFIIGKEFGNEIDDVRQSRCKLASELGIYTQSYDCCVQNCMAFIGEHWLRRTCKKCKSTRYLGTSADSGEFFTRAQQFSSLKALTLYQYLPIIPRLKLLYASPRWSEKMRYPRSMLNKPWAEGIKDVWEGKIMQDMKQKGMRHSY